MKTVHELKIESVANCIESWALGDYPGCTREECLREASRIIRHEPVVDSLQIAAGIKLAVQRGTITTDEAKLI
jgi:hypothetical protein